MIPALLKQYLCSVGGQQYPGLCDVTPPKLAVKTEDYEAGGMDASVAIRMGMEQPEMAWTMYQRVPAVLKLFGLADGNQAAVTFRGAEENNDVNKIKIEARGLVTEVEEDEWAVRKKTGVKFKMKCRTFKYTVNGEVVYEIDIERMICIIGGVDQMAKISEALKG